MKRASVLAIAATLVCAGVAPFATAQQGADDFTPEGYKFCGWRNLSDGSWTYGQPEDGAFLRGFAYRMTCRDARRNITRVRYSQRPPYRPLRMGYRCKTLDSDHEYSDVRCVKVGGKRKFRFQTGA